MMDPMKSGEWHQMDEWILLCHEPVMFRGEFPGVTMSTVLRDPVDAIASQILKTTYGFSSRTIAGRQEVIDAQMEFLNDPRQEYLKESLYQECRMWSGYSFGARLAIDRIVPFTFEQVTQQTTEVLTSLYSVAGSSNNFREIDERYIAGYIEARTREAQKDIAFTSGASNGLPTEKPEEYYVIREAVENYKMLPYVLDEYELTKEMFAKRQKDLGILQN